MYKVVSDNQINLKIQVKTNAHSREIIVYNDAIDMKVKSLAKKGKANEEIIEFLSELLSINSNFIEIVKGIRSTTKYIAIYSPDHDEILEKLSKFRPVQKKQ